jgi:hypothetical protein
MMFVVSLSFIYTILITVYLEKFQINYMLARPLTLSVFTYFLTRVCRTRILLVDFISLCKKCNNNNIIPLVFTMTLLYIGPILLTCIRFLC